jgi:hypothetical protein
VAATRRSRWMGLGLWPCSTPSRLEAYTIHEAHVDDWLCGLGKRCNKRMQTRG